MLKRKYILTGHTLDNQAYIWAGYPGFFWYKLTIHFLLLLFLRIARYRPNLEIASYKITIACYEVAILEKKSVFPPSELDYSLIDN